MALASNQVMAVSKMIQHIIKYHNHYYFSYLFEKNLVHIMLKGIEVANLFNSNVFYQEFDSQDWATIHHDPKQMIVPYNGCLFSLKT